MSREREGVPFTPTCVLCANVAGTYEWYFHSVNSMNTG